jgi:hypothetical protein
MVIGRFWRVTFSIFFHYPLFWTLPYEYVARPFGDLVQSLLFSPQRATWLSFTMESFPVPYCPRGAPVLLIIPRGLVGGHHFHWSLLFFKAPSAHFLKCSALRQSSVCANFLFREVHCAIKAPSSRSGGFSLQYLNLGGGDLRTMYRQQLLTCVGISAPLKNISHTSPSYTRREKIKNV